MNRHFFLFLILVLGLSACKTIQIAQSGNLRKHKSKYLIEQLEKNRIDYNWFVAKAKVKFESKEQNIGFTVKMRIRQDSVIWMTITKVSIEGMRLRMTPDRIELLRRDESQYISETFESIQSKMPLPLQFKDIENLLVGNPLSALRDIDFDVTMDSTHYILSGDLPDPKNTANKKGDLKLWLDAEFRLAKVYAKVDQNTVEATFSDYQPISDNNPQKLALEKEIVLNSPESGEVRLKINFNKIELNEPQETNFEVPEHYEQIISGNKVKGK